LPCDSAYDIGAFILPDDLIHSINNQLAIVMGNAQLLGLEVDNCSTRETCRKIQAAASKINKLLYEYANHRTTGRHSAS
jgi:nitrogen-specific signal transduction histidine kinase